jgi:hypothetical protein
MTTLLEPTRELRRLATRIDFALGQYLSVRGNSALNSEFEAPRHGWTLSNLALRHAEATLALAKTDMVLAPTAWITARAALESAAKCLWLLEPDDEWQREARFVAFLTEGVRIKREETEGLPHIVAQSASIEEFKDGVKAKLLEKRVDVPNVPSMKNILLAENLGLAQFYVLASQYTHAAELGTRSYRKDLGTKAVFGEFVAPKDWIQPMWIAYSSFRVTALRLVDLQGEDRGEDLELADRQVSEARDDFLAAF